MAIIGLESDYYCAHTPIPVKITPLMPLYNNMYVGVSNPVTGMSVGSRLYHLNFEYYVDLSPWVKQLMNELIDNRTYYKPGSIEAINDQVVTLEINFVERDPDEGAANDQIQYVQKSFVQCALYEGRYTDPVNNNIKMWRGYPISSHDMQSRETLYFIPDGDTAPNVNPWIIEYVSEVCRGSYLKWLNEYGSYSYWFFSSGRQENDEAENIYDVNRSIFNPDKSSNYDTVGFEAESRFTVRDMVKKEYWHLFKSLVSSPEVYILKEGWIDVYLGGATELTPDWWIKVRQTDFEFERVLFKNSMAEVEIELEYPKPYTQKRI